ncbi:MAG: hypothetical protein GX758_04845 [Tenericutes bacterium]|nr:hypothetical protein [Mycoplasmatota bacterium]
MDDELKETLKQLSDETKESLGTLRTYEQSGNGIIDVEVNLSEKYADSKLKEVYEIAFSTAKKENINPELISCTDIGDKYVFGFQPKEFTKPLTWDLSITINKTTKEIGYFLLSTKNIELLKNGIKIDILDII